MISLPLVILHRRCRNSTISDHPQILRKAQDDTFAEEAITLENT